MKMAFSVKGNVGVRKVLNCNEPFGNTAVVLNSIVSNNYYMLSSGGKLKKKFP